MIVRANTLYVSYELNENLLYKGFSGLLHLIREMLWNKNLLGKGCACMLRMKMKRYENPLGKGCPGMSRKWTNNSRQMFPAYDMHDDDDDGVVCYILIWI